MSEKQKQRLAKEAKALAVLAFRAGPIENIHADGRISQAEMKAINKKAVDKLFLLLSYKKTNPAKYWQFVELINQTIAREWDDPYADAVKLSTTVKDLRSLLD